jgi:hypothetical protein
MTTQFIPHKNILRLRYKDQPVNALYGRKIAVYYEKYMERTNTLYG